MDCGSLKTKMKNFIYLISTVFLLVMASGCVSDSQQATDKQNMEDIVPDSENMEDVEEGISLSEVAEHNLRDDCWLVIHGKVYDVTDWIPIHPGGDAILEGCGKDASTLYETRPMGSGTPHSQSARDRLEDYYIGDLV